MPDSWKNSATHRAQRAKVNAGLVPEDSPWDKAGNLQMPGWLKGMPPMPELWPLWYFWSEVGRLALREGLIL